MTYNFVNTYLHPLIHMMSHSVHLHNIRVMWMSHIYTWNNYTRLGPVNENASTDIRNTCNFQCKYQKTDEKSIFTTGFELMSGRSYLGFLLVTTYAKFVSLTIFRFCFPNSNDLVGRNLATSELFS